MNDVAKPESEVISEEEANELNTRMQALIDGRLEEMRPRIKTEADAVVEMAVNCDLIAHIAATLTRHGRSESAQVALDRFIPLMFDRIKELSGEGIGIVADMPKQVQ